MISSILPSITFESQLMRLFRSPEVDVLFGLDLQTRKLDFHHCSATKDIRSK